MIAIAADSVSDTARLQTRLPAITLLTDLELAAASAWGVRVPGAESPSPGTFVVTREGAVKWRRLEDERGDWPTYGEVVTALENTAPALAHPTGSR